METIQTVETSILPTAITVELPTAEQTAEAEQTAKVLEGLATITTELRQIVTTAGEVARHCANALSFAARMAGPGNVRQFKAILGDCEKAILAESKVAKWTELGPEARSYLAYKAQFAQWINDVKSSLPDGVDPVTLRLQVSRWYANRPKGPAAGDGSKGTGAKRGNGGKSPPVIQTGDTDEETGEKVGLTVGTSKATIKVKGSDGKFTDETVNFPPKVQGGISKVLRFVAKRWHDAPSEATEREILAALEMAADLLIEQAKKAK